MPSKFNEGKYIAMAMINNLQTTAFAVLLAAFIYDVPLAFFIIKWLAVVVSDFGTLCFIFIRRLVEPPVGHLLDRHVGGDPARSPDREQRAVRREEQRHHDPADNGIRSKVERSHRPPEVPRRGRARASGSCRPWCTRPRSRA